MEVHTFLFMFRTQNKKRGHFLTATYFNESESPLIIDSQVYEYVLRYVLSLLCIINFRLLIEKLYSYEIK